jgi:glyceraldehyde 3-phosphate dehydrogenase
MAIRVPTPNVSLIDLVAEVDRETSSEEVNAIFKEVSQNALKGILRYEEKPLVSVDYNGADDSTIIDALSTKVIGKNMVKVLSWYDNEWGYSSRTKDILKYLIKKGI